MANQVAKGNSGVDHSGLANKTPAPTKVDPRTVTEFQKDYTFGRGNYGNNAYGGPSSLTPGMTTDGIPNLAQKRDAVLDEIQASGTARNVMTGDATGRTWPGKDSMSTRGLAQHDDGLLEDIASGERGGGAKSRPVPVHSSMAKRSVDEGSPGGSVGSGLNNNQSDPVRKPS